MENPNKNKHKSRIRPKKARRVIGCRHYKNYSDEMLEIACELVTARTISSREAERQFGIPRRTILNKCKKKHANPVGHPTALTAEEEEKIVKVLRASSDFGSPLTKLDLKVLVYEYLKKNSRSHIFKDNIPGDAWVAAFLARHANDLCLRSTQNISKARSEKGPEEIAEYFENLGQTLKDIPPENIINFDETNLSDDPGSVKGIFRRGVKHPERIMNSSKGNISLMYTGTASGQLLPLYVVYKATNKYSEWVSGGPPDTRYNCTKSGWFDSAMFEDYFEQIILPWARRTPGTKVIICDNLSSHLNIKVIELCDENNIKFVFIPPRTTHLTQPLDVAFFAPLKKAWRQILAEYKVKNPKETSLNKKHFPKLLSNLSEAIKLNEKKNIQSGFKAAGVFPFNPQEVLKKIPDMQEAILAYGIDQALLDYLKENRAPKPMTVQRNKKVYCEPGKSVTISDINYKCNEKSQSSTKMTKNRKKTGSKVQQVKVLNDKTGVFANSDSDDSRFDSFLAETDKETTANLKSPESLNLSCINVINSCLGTVHKKIQPPKLSREFPPVRASTSFGDIKSSKSSGRVKVLSDLLIDVAPSTSNVCFLGSFSNKEENTPFTASGHNDLPECLQINNKEVLSKLITINPSKKGKTSKANIKQEKNIKHKVPLRESSSENRMKTQSDDFNMIPAYDLRDSEISEYQQERKPKMLAKVKKEKAVEKEKSSKRKHTSKKNNQKRKKAYRSSAKRRTQRADSESSSISVNSDAELITAESDNSNYETMHDLYIAECLREQDDKENFEDDEIPFGLRDIEYFTGETSKLKEGDWIIARFSTKKSVKHFVGNILSMKGDIPTVKFARKVKNSKCEKGTAFSYPTVDDICTIPHLEDIVTLLPEPKVARRGQTIFDVDFKNFNIQ